MFDEENPPQDYKKFKREVLRSVEDSQIELDEDFDTALFTVSRKNKGEVFYISDLIDKFDEDTSLKDIIEEEVPERIKKNNAKFFAFVFPGNHHTEDGESPEIVAVLMGALWDIQMVFAEVMRDDDEEIAELSPWHTEDTSNYPNLVIPFRQAITLQG